jgi:hypothetical protein
MTKLFIFTLHDGSGWLNCVTAAPDRETARKQVARHLVRENRDSEFTLGHVLRSLTGATPHEKPLDGVFEVRTDW